MKKKKFNISINYTFINTCKLRQNAKFFSFRINRNLIIFYNCFNVKKILKLHELFEPIYIIKLKLKCKHYNLQWYIAFLKKFDLEILQIIIVHRKRRDQGTRRTTASLKFWKLIFTHYIFGHIIWLP